MSTQAPAAARPRRQGGILAGRSTRLTRGYSGALRLGVALAVILVVLDVGLPLVMHLNPGAVNLFDRFRSLNTPGHPLGTDDLGRDVLARVVYGFRWSVGVAATATTVLILIGGLAGVIAAAVGGIVQQVVVRAIDLSISLPYLVIAVVILAVLGHGFVPLCLTLGVVSWPIFARVIYTESRSLLQRDYVLAARLAGVRPYKSVLTHVIPGLKTVTMVMTAFLFADMIVAESALSFLGLGATLGSPSLGTMLSDGRTYMVTAPTLTVIPGAAIVLAVITANLIGDGIAHGASSDEGQFE
ncbi:MAG TPA: ABC transporter permease [Streptosporangiaceae bacterium]|nr:ABC transporter permease [Streptosporangiaceae bacterium]